jgi:hypothetical protein
MSSLAKRRRETEIYSLSFLDCICCGFGAVLLIFILTIARKTDVDKSDVDAAREQLRRVEARAKLNQDELDRLAAMLAAAQLELRDLSSKNKEDETKVSDRRKQLLLMLQEIAAMQEALASLLGEKRDLPTEDKAPPVPIPNPDRRQYLTGVRLNGEFVVFLVRVSGSMLDDTIDGAAARLDDPDDKKRASLKWQRVVAAMTWMLASLEPETRFQILLFNEETVPLLPKRGEEWFSTRDQKTMGEVIARLNQIVPNSIVLLTDGLPTGSDSLPPDGDVDEGTRVRLFEIARKQLPPRVPVSTILFPMLSGDPGAPGLYWELANATRGALVSPSRSWPEL